MIRIKKISIGILKFAVVALFLSLAFAPPTYFLIQELRPQHIFTYEAAKRWQVQQGDINTYPGCAYVLFNKYIAYCANDQKSTSDSTLDSIRIDRPIEVKQSFFSHIFDLSGTPLDTEICFKIDNHFEGYPNQEFDGQTRLFIYKKPINQVEQIDEKDTIVLTTKKKECIASMSGMTLFALGPAESQFFDKNFYEGLQKSGKFNFMKPDSNIINYTLSGSKSLINGIEVGGSLEEIRPGEFVYHANLYKDTVDFNIVKTVEVTSRIPWIQKITLGIAVYSVWLLIVFGLIENMKKLWLFLQHLLPNSLVVFLKKATAWCKSS